MWFSRRRRPQFTTYYFLIGGQSNAAGRGTLGAVHTREQPDARVRMFGNDYVLKPAYEPVDDSAGQIDTVSDDGGAVGHSFALRAAKNVVQNAAKSKTVLIPCAMGGTGMNEWMPGANRLDRSTLFGSANYRHDQVLPVGGLTALLYYGHEGNSDDADRPDYAADWAALMAEFRAEWGANLPVIFAQLAKNTGATANHEQHLAAEIQRLQETGSGDALAMAHMRMVVTFDLPLDDAIHLSKTAQIALGDRIGLAIRQHVLGQSVDGTGPRLNGAPAHPGGDKSKIKIDTTQALETISGNADNQFRVFDGGSEMTITSVVRDPADASAILITMSATASTPATVSYGDVAASGTGVTLSNVVKNAAGLPLPQFGLQTVV